MAGSSSRPSWMEGGFWEHEYDEITSYYPEALPIRFADAFGWRVVMDPIPPADGVEEVLIDLSLDRDMSVGRRGMVRCLKREANQDVRCCGPAEIANVTIPRRPYIVEVEYPLMLQGPVGPIHPKARVVGPELSIRSYPWHPHMNLGEDGDSWACPLSPHATSWSWLEGATWSYLAQVALWIVKTEVWGRTGGGVGNSGCWPGSAVPHTPAYIVQAVAGANPCRCGSGLSYRNCHLVFDSVAACH